MIIETKGTRETQAPDGAQRYRGRDEPNSATPYYLALAVTAVAAYLKSLFHTPAKALAQPEEDTPEPKTGPRLYVQAIPDEESAAPEPDMVRPASVGGSAPQSEGPASAYDSGPILPTRELHFANPESGTNLNDFKPSPVIAMPNNDNGGRISQGGGDGGGGRPRGSETPPDRTATAPGHVDGNAPPNSSDPTDTDETPDDDEEEPGPDGRRNRAPVASGPVHLADVTGCAMLPIALSALLANVVDPDGDSLSVRNLRVSSGTLARDGDGWLFDGDAPGPVTITYEVTDGEFAITHSAVFNVVERNQMVGSNADDLILGTLCADEIDGRDGDDNIDARAGNDIVDGGKGDDHIVGGSGDDILRGGAGDDVVFAGTGNDRVSGGAGNDRLFGEDGDDILSGEDGDDLLDGGAGSDILLGGAGRDTLLGGVDNDRLDGGDGDDQVLGGSGHDVVSGGDGDDHLYGEAGNDTLSDGAGRDVASGGEGDDVFVVSLDGESDRFDGGEGSDTLDLTATVSGVAVDLAAGTSVGNETGHDAVASIETVLGGAGDDVFTGSSANETLRGGEGRDSLSGGGGADILDGGADEDALFDGAGTDIVLGGAGDDLLAPSLDGESDRFDGGEGKDTLDLSETTEGVAVDLANGSASGAEIGCDTLVSIEHVDGGSGDDTLAGDDKANALSGGDGNDDISGGGESDLLAGGAGDDTLSDGAGCDVVLGEEGDDLIVVAADGESDRFDGGEGSDTLDLSRTRAGIVADLRAGTASGVEIGQDIVQRIETLVGGSGDDTLSGSDGNDRILGAAGDDLIVARSGDDVVSDGAGRDVVDAGAGDDVIVLAMDGEDDDVSGGEGKDTLDLSEATADLIVDLVNKVVSGSENGTDKVDSIERVVAGSGNDRFVIGDGNIVLTGGEGDDCYDFGAAPAGEATRAVQITDFAVGDHVSLLRYTLFEEGTDSLGQSLAEAMESNEGAVSGIQYRSARVDGADVTIITADLDGNDTFETTIVLDGNHTFIFVEDVPATQQSTPVV